MRVIPDVTKCMILRVIPKLSQENINQTYYIMYKLINKQTGEERICEKVTIDSFDYYVSDEKTLSNNGDWYLGHPNYNTLFRWEMNGIHEGKQVWINKVIATTNPNINIPKVVDEVDSIGYQWFVKADKKDTIFDLGWLNIFKGGYNKSQETHSNSDEDMIEFSEFIDDLGYTKIDNTVWKSINDEKGKSTKELLQLWKEQQPKIVYYE